MALCQLAVSADKQHNLATARSAIDEAATAGRSVERLGRVGRRGQAPCRCCYLPGPLVGTLQHAVHARCNASKAHIQRMQPAELFLARTAPSNVSTGTLHRLPAPPPAGADLVVLPEMWNCPYSNDSFPTYAEDVEGGASPSAAMLADAAAANKVVLVSGAPN